MKAGEKNTKTAETNRFPWVRLYFELNMRSCERQRVVPMRHHQVLGWRMRWRLRRQVRRFVRGWRHVRTWLHVSTNRGPVRRVRSKFNTH